MQKERKEKYLKLNHALTNRAIYYCIKANYDNLPDLRRALSDYETYADVPSISALSEYEKKLDRIARLDIVRIYATEALYRTNSMIASDCFDKDHRLLKLLEFGEKNEIASYVLSCFRSININSKYLKVVSEKYCNSWENKVDQRLDYALLYLFEGKCHIVAARYALDHKELLPSEDDDEDGIERSYIRGLKRSHQAVKEAFQAIRLHQGTGPILHLEHIAIKAVTNAAYCGQCLYENFDIQQPFADFYQEIQSQGYFSLARDRAERLNDPRISYVAAETIGLAEKMGLAADVHVAADLLETSRSIDPELTDGRWFPEWLIEPVEDVPYLQSALWVLRADKKRPMWRTITRDPAPMSPLPPRPGTS